MLDSTPRQLLLIDNVPDSLEAIAARAQAGGWTVHRHTSAATAIRDLRNLAPEVVMTRLELPILSGRQVVLAVRSVDEDLPVVTFSDQAELETAVALMRAGAFDCLIRPLAQPRNLDTVLERAHVRATTVRDQRRMASELEEAQAKIARHLEQEAVIRQRALERIEKPMQEVFQQISRLKELQHTEEGLGSVDILLRTMLNIRRVLDRAEHDSTMSGQHALAMEEFHVQDTVEFVRDALMERAHERGIELAFFVPANIPPHRGDPPQLRAVLVGLCTYLLDNKRAGCVHINVETAGRGPGPWVFRFEVSDHMGNAKPQGPDVLEQHLPGDDTGSTPNVQIELSMTVRTSQLMGGDLELVVERSVGRMFSFQVAFLPAKTEDKALPAHDLPQGSVMVVEPEGLVRRCVANELTKLGMRTAVAGSIDQAWAIIEKSAKAGPMDAVFLSGGLGDADELVEALDTLPEDVRPSVFWMTRSGEYTTQTDATVLARPPRRRDLISAMKTCLPTAD